MQAALEEESQWDEILLLDMGDQFNLEKPPIKKPKSSTLDQETASSSGGIVKSS